MIYFGVVVVIDLEYKLIMHPVSLVGVALGLYIGVLSNGFTVTIIGGLVGFGVMWLLYVLGELILRWISQRRGQSSEEVALGFGDVNLSGVLGLMLGWPGILVGLTWAILLGGIVSMVYLVIMLILRRYQLFSALPYGPFLVAGAFLVIFLGDTISTVFWG
jgi:leader peptidase (prepilin peptidase)/N-methyltransferase